MDVRPFIAVVDCADRAMLSEVVRRRLTPFAENGTRVGVVLLRTPPRLRDHLLSLGMSVRMSDASVHADWMAVRDLATYAREIGASLLYAHGEVAHSLSALVSPLARIPVVAHATRPIGIADLHAHALCRSTIVVATEAARAQALALGCADVTVVPTPEFDSRDSTTGWTARDGEDDDNARKADARDGPTFGWAGEWADEDNPELFLRAMGKIVSSGAPCRARMAVTSTRVPAHAKRLTTLLGDRLSIVPLAFGRRGFTRDVDVFVRTAWTDAVHLTLVDAFASNLRVIATSVGGSAEFMGSQRRLWLFRPGNEDALAQAMMAALIDEPYDTVGATQAKLQTATNPPSQLLGKLIAARANAQRSG